MPIPAKKHFHGNLPDDPSDPVPGERTVSRDKAIEIAQVCHGLSLADAAKYIDAILARGDRQVRFRHELVDIEP